MKKTVFFILVAALIISCEGKTRADHESESSAPAEPAAQAAPAATGSTEAIATINGAAVSLRDIFSDKDVSYKTKNDLYEAQKNALDDYLFMSLVGKEAEKKNTTREEVLKAEIDGKIKKVSDRDVKNFYDELSKNRGGQLPPLDKVAEQIKKKLAQDNGMERKDQYFEELKRKYKVAYLMTKPKVSVGVGDNPPRGNAKAPVTIVEFSDFECPFCKRVEPTLEKILKEYRGKVKLYFRDFPLEFHQKAKPAAIASRCAGEQGKYWEFHDKAYEKQELADENLNKFAADLKLDVEKFKKCRQEQKVAASIAKDMEEGSKLGVTGTPAFFINGVFISGAQPYERFKKEIDEELKGLKKSGSGTP